VTGAIFGYPESTYQADSAVAGPDGSLGTGPAWNLLAAGRYDDALSRFAIKAQSNPRRSAPKTGYALAAAGVGDTARGVWAMRRAFRIDPDGVEYVRVDEKLRPRVETLLRRYEADLRGPNHHADSAFMVASLHYLLGDYEAARTTLQQAVDYGDRNTSAANLERLLSQHEAPSAQARGE